MGEREGGREGKVEARNELYGPMQGVTRLKKSMMCKGEMGRSI